MGPLEPARSARRDISAAAARPALPTLRDPRHGPDPDPDPDDMDGRPGPEDSDGPGTAVGVPGARPPGDVARSWREWPVASAATILPGRGSRRMHDRAGRTAPAAGLPVETGPPAGEVTPTADPAPVDDVAPADQGPVAVDAPGPLDVHVPLGAPAPFDAAGPLDAPAPVEGLAVEEARPVPESRDASPEEIIAGTVIAASAPTAWVAQRPTVATDGAADSVREAVADLQAHIERAGAEIRAMVAGHRAEVAAARSDFAPIRDWLARARATAEREAQERAEERTAGHGTTAAPPACTMPAVPVDPLRIMTSATGRIGLPSRHAAAAQEWATAGHRGAVEVTHPGARRRVGVAVAVYAATLGHTVRAVVADRAVAESWRTDLAAHAPEISVVVDTGLGPPGGRADVVVRVGAPAGGTVAGAAATLLVLGDPGMADSVDPRCPWRLVLAGPGEWAAAGTTVREHVDHRLVAAG